MPRPVVPIRRLPRNRSVTLSTVRWYGRDHVRAARDQQPRDVDTALGEAVELVEQHRQVDDDAVADHRRAARREDARGQQVQRVLLVVDDHGVPGVVAAVVLDDVVDAGAQGVGGLALALVAPLRADHDDRGHGAPASGGRSIHGRSDARQVTGHRRRRLHEAYDHLAGLARLVNVVTTTFTRRASLGKGEAASGSGRVRGGWRRRGRGGPASRRRGRRRPGRRRGARRGSAPGGRRPRRCARGRRRRRRGRRGARR